MQNRLSIEKCRSLIPSNNKLSDDTILNQRNRLYALAGYVVEKFEKLKSFITRSNTIDAKARIVK